MATTALLNRRRQILVKAETVKGTSVHPLAAADGKFLVIDAQVSSFNFETFERNFTRETLSPTGVITTSKSMEISFSIEVRRTNTSTTPDAWGLLLQACGFAQTTPSAVVYKPTSDVATMKTVSMAINVDGLEHRMVGAMGSVEFVGEVGSVMLMNFTFTGVYIGTVELAARTITHESGQPIPFQGIDLNYNSRLRYTLTSDPTPATGGTYTLTIDAQTTSAIAFDATAAAVLAAVEALSNVTVGTVAVTVSGSGTDLGDASTIYTIDVPGFDPNVIVMTANFASITGNPHALAEIAAQEPCVTGITANMNNEVSALRCANSASGIDFYLITARNPELTLDPRLVLPSEDDRLDFFDQLNESEYVAVDWLNGTSGKFLFEAQRAQIRNIGEAEENGVATGTLTMQMTTLTADDEFVITVS